MLHYIKRLKDYKFGGNVTCTWRTREVPTDEDKYLKTNFLSLHTRCSQQISFCLSSKMDRLIFISLLIVAVNGQCPTNLTAICTDCVTYNDEMGINLLGSDTASINYILGCLYADSREESKFDNYQKALDHCRFENTGGSVWLVIFYQILSRGLMGGNAILAEATNEDQHNILVEIIRVNQQWDIIKSSNVLSGSRSIPGWTWVLLVVE